MSLNDMGYAARMMRRAPLFTAAVVLTLTLAIGANTTIFSVVNAVLLTPLPFRKPNRLVQVAEKNDKLHLASFGASVLNFLSWREQTQTLEGLAAVGFSNYTLTGSGEPEQLSGNRISPALTQVLGINPIVGRAFTDDEEKPSATAVAMIGEGLWKRRFGADRSLIGRTITLNGTPTTVVGVAPAALNLISGGDVYTPLTIDPAKEIRLNHVIFVFARLKAGVSMAQAQAEMNAISVRMGQQYPEIREWGIRLISLFDTFVSPELKTGLLVLLWAVGFVLLIACANIANLLLARAAARQGEMAVRTAIGASRGRLVRQLLVESVVLSIGGGACGVLVALWALRAINHSLPPNLLPVPVIEIDPTVMWFALGLTLLTGLLFGVAPALRTASVDLSIVLKHGGRGSSARMSARLRNGLAATELALATVLLIGAGLLIQSLANLQHVRLGFGSRNLMTFQLAPPVDRYPVDSKAPQLYRALLDSLQAIPGVRGASTSSGIPFGAGNYNTHPMITTERSSLPPDTQVPIDWRIVSPGYFRTMGIPLLEGRDFTDADGPSAPPVVIISRATAEKFWGDADPIGHTLRRSADRNTAFTVVGVVGDVRSTVLTQESAALYYPMARRVAPLTDVVVRTDGSPETMLPAIRQKVHELDTELALANVKTIDEWLANSAAQPRLNTVLLTVFAAVALLIASIGIYGVLAYSVSQRTSEIGVRLALGATPPNVLRLVVGEGMRVALIGIGIGLLAGLALGRVVSSLVFGVPVRDPVTFAVVGVALASIALAACAIPAFRASRVDPIVALRYE
ncbi:MAG TPA: ABC transporter permease [Candidatus Sulfotelmatobacter sp.]|nr:ABC transporter permease [Candidatus Sulfotelmatobacter sp.]